MEDPVTPWRRVSLNSKALPRAVGLETQELKGIQLTRSLLGSSVALTAKSGGGFDFGALTEGWWVSPYRPVGFIDCLLPEFPPCPDCNCSL